MTKEPLYMLVIRAQAGDPLALAELLRRFRPLVRKCCRGLPPFEREDLEQELYLLISRIVLEYRLDDAPSQGPCLCEGGEWADQIDA